jgi:hypothetical protein
MTLDRANGSPVLEEDDSDSPSPLSPPSRSPFLFGSRPEEGTSLPPLDGPESASATGSPSDGQQLPDETEPESSTTSSAASSGSGLVSKTQLKDTFRAGVQVGTSTANRLGARTPGQQHVGLYLADKDDVHGIADPLAEIAYRRGGLAGAGGKLSPDTNNALQAVMALAGYIAKQVRGVTEARKIDGQISAGVLHVADDTDDDEAA